MQKEKKSTVGQWCDHWFQTNRNKWDGNTEGGYRNLIYIHIIPCIGSVELTGLTAQTVSGFYDDLRSQGLSARSIRASICFCGGAWMTRHGSSSYSTTRCDSARSLRRRNTKPPRSVWGRSSVT